MADETSQQTNPAPRGVHIGYWDRGAWRPWCEVYRDFMPDQRPIPPTDEVCADCFALAIGEIAEELEVNAT